MNASGWVLLMACHLLLQQSRAQPNRLYGDVGKDEAMIDNLESIMQNGEGQQEFQDYGQFNYRSVPLKIPFAVGPRDPRYHYPTSVLREASLHSNIYGHDSLSPESRRAIQHVWEEAARSQAYYDANYPQNLEDQQETQETAGVHGQRKNTKAAESKAEPAQNAHLKSSMHHVQQLPHLTVDKQSKASMSLPDFYFVALVSGITAIAVCAAVGAGICYFRLHKSKRDAAEAEYPAYGVTGPNNLSPGAADRKLAQSAHMFHYQHQKQQMIALEKSSGDDRHCSGASDIDSEEEGDEGDYTVYECPGLAPTGEMEVKNPLFSDDPTPATPPAKANGLRRDSLEDKAGE